MFYSWVVRHGFVVLVNPVMRGCVAERGTSKFYKCSGGWERVVVVRVSVKLLKCSYVIDHLFPTLKLVFTFYPLRALTAQNPSKWYGHRLQSYCCHTPASGTKTAAAFAIPRDGSLRNSSLLWPLI